MSNRYTSRTAIFALLTLGLACAPTTAAAQGHEHAEGEDHHHRLHFAHPMIAESVTPDTKLRLDHRFFDFAEGDENSGVLEAEYAFHRSLSLEFGFPFSYTESEPGNLEAILKFANYAFEDAGLLLGYGAGVTFPTAGDTPDHGAVPETLVRGKGSGYATAAALRSAASASEAPTPRFHTGGAGVAGSLGTDAWELSPFVNLGYRAGDLELVGWALLGVPFGHDQAEPELSTTLGFNLSGLYRVSDRFQAILELDGGGGVNGEAVGEDVVNLTPGAKFRLLPGRPLWLGASYAVPLSDEELFDSRFQASAFLHF